MIRLTLLQALTFYILVFLASVVVAWLFYVVERGLHERRRMHGRIRCRFCATVFEDHSSEVLTRCPACGRLNMKIKNERI